MKKICIILTAIIFLSGCKKEDEDKFVEPVISSKGELVCAYKKQNTSENTIYTSYYIYNFDNNGILKDVINHEEIEFNDSSDEVKDKYKESIKEILEEYKDIDGIKVSTKYNDEAYYFEVKIDKSKMNDENKEKFLLNQDRIHLYKKYTSNQYTCE